MHLLLVTAIAVLVTASGSRSDAAPSGSGRIAFASYDRLYSVRPDGSRLRVLSRFGRRRVGDLGPAWSRQGLIAFTRTDGRNSALYSMRANGTGVRRLVGRGYANTTPAWSPDGRFIAYEDAADTNVDTSSIKVLELATGRVRQLTAGEHGDESPSWSPDGKTIAFSRKPPVDYIPERAGEIMLMNPDGSNVRSLRREGSDPAWSPDGKRIAFVSSRDRNGQTCLRDYCFPHHELYVMNADGSQPRRLTRSKADNLTPTWSPRGAWIAYAGGFRVRPRGRFRIYRIRSRGGRPRLVKQMRFSAGEPSWSPATVR